jgi:hypothetical protein
MLPDAFRRALAIGPSIPAALERPVVLPDAFRRALAIVPSIPAALERPVVLPDAFRWRPRP